MGFRIIQNTNYIHKVCRLSILKLISNPKLKGAQNSSFILLQNIEKVLQWDTEGFKYF
jgi:hypothetical protein